MKCPIDVIRTPRGCITCSPTSILTRRLSSSQITTRVRGGRSGLFAVAGLIIEAENILNRLEEATPKIAAEIRSGGFEQIVAKAEQGEKKFMQFGEEEEKALQGHAGGQFNVGNSYAIGFAMVSKNLVLAHMWFSLSAPQGNEEAVKSRDMVALKMTPAQIAEAQALERDDSTRKRILS
jgi:hypothetical protein